MTAERVRALLRPMVLPALALAAAACGGSGSGQSGGAFTFLSIDRITGNAGGAANSSLDDTTASTAVCVRMSNNLKNPGVTTPTPLDSVTITSYTVTFTRFGPGEPPGPFTINTSFTVPAGTISDTGAPADNSVSVLVVVVPAHAKREPPLANPTPPLPVSTTADIVFQGRNGRGNGVSVEGAVAVNFIGGVATETFPACT